MTNISKDLQPKLQLQKASPFEAGIAHILLIIVLLIGLVGGVYLVQRSELFKTKSKATASEILEAVEIRDANGNPLQCDTSTDPNLPTCTTTTKDISVTVKKSDALRSD